MKLSIITICYNEPNLERTCQSIVNQTWQDFEWIVIDGGSNDDTQKIWDKYKYRINKFISEKDSGIYNAMNKGIRLASGEYLIFLNAGDFYDNKNVLKNIMKNDFDKDIISCDIKFLKKNNKIQKWTSPETVNDEFLILYSLPHPATFIRKNLFDKYGLYNEDYKIVSDYEKWIQFIKIHNCSYKHIPIFCSVFNCMGISSSNNELRFKEKSEILQKYFTQEAIMRSENSNRVVSKYTLLQKIFSIKNSPNKTHKIITFLGFHVNIKLRKRDK